jgi:hypothetical protein
MWSTVLDVLRSLDTELLGWPKRSHLRTELPTLIGSLLTPHHPLEGLHLNSRKWQATTSPGVQSRATYLPNYHWSPLASPSDGWLHSGIIFPPRLLPCVFSKSVHGCGLQFSCWGSLRWAPSQTINPVLAFEPLSASSILTLTKDRPISIW